MIKDASSLIKINITWEKNYKNVSFESAFEHYLNIIGFNLDGFDTSQITSLNKLFHETSLAEINLSTLIQDTFIMFELTRIRSVDFSNFGHKKHLKLYSTYLDIYFFINIIFFPKPKVSGFFLYIQGFILHWKTSFTCLPLNFPSWILLSVFNSRRKIYNSIFKFISKAIIMLYLEFCSII